MRRDVMACLAAFLATLALLPAARAADAPQTDTAAFEYAQAMSFYGFDGCGDGVTGRLFRRALADKFAHCPFTPAARTRYAERARAQQTKSSDLMRHIIDTNGGMPVKLDGMTRTCREQIDSSDYQHLRGLLEQYSRGEVTADAIFPAPCDAKSLIP
jgi:hypothetical protein